MCARASSRPCRPIESSHCAWTRKSLPCFFTSGTITVGQPSNILVLDEPSSLPWVALTDFEPPLLASRREVKVQIPASFPRPLDPAMSRIHHESASEEDALFDCPSCLAGTPNGDIFSAGVVLLCVYSGMTLTQFGELFDVLTPARLLLQPFTAGMTGISSDGWNALRRQCEDILERGHVCGAEREVILSMLSPEPLHPNKLLNLLS